MARPRTDISARILKAAKRRFRERGVDGTSLRTIAKDARTSIGMIYYYFPTKDDLFLAVVEQTYQKLLVDLEQAITPGVPFAERLVRLYERIGAASKDELDVLRMFLQEALFSSSRFERVVSRFLRGHVPLVLAMLVDGVGEQALDARRHPMVLLFATFALAGPPQLMRKVLDKRLPVPGAPAGNALARELVDVLLHGIAARA
jgi:AcrR family transcriptional regulator